MTSLKRLYRHWKRRLRDRKLVSLISQSEFFDRDYYLNTNPDIAKANIDPLRHYIYHGRHEGRAPSPHFDPDFYLHSNPDVSKAGIDPVVHYLYHGRAERRASQSPQQMISASRLFDADYYRARYIDVALSGQDPLHHYVNYGRQEGRRPSLDFDPFVYLAKNPDLQQANIDPILHYIQSGRAEGRCCRDSGLSSRELPEALVQLRSSGLFDDAFYLCQYPAVREAGVDPLLHYLVAGFSQYVDPSPVFSTIEYLDTHSEVRASGSNPLLELLTSGLNEAIEGNVTIANPTIENAAEPPYRRPDDAIRLERMAGLAYFDRFLFSFDSVDSPGNYIIDAITDLVCRAPKLTIDRIEPDVSIIIPVYGQLRFVLSCLDSLSRHRSRFSVEIIVADDVSPAAAQIRRLEAIPWIRYYLRESNGGFVDTCNDAARIARGRVLVFLNSDTRVAENWLDELIGSFELFSKAGLVGSKLFNDDGSLQEAGGIYWRDGSAWNYGHNDDPNHPKYCFARQVDYVSGASIAVPSEIWHCMRGFDTIYWPAYCEDADLAFRLRQAGYEVWLQPLSCVLHYEGKTHGRDLHKGVKGYQKVNLRRLGERWRGTLASHRPNGQEPDREANRTVGDRILVLDAITPMPDRDSGSFITFRMLRALQLLGYQVTFIPQHSYVFDGSYTAALQRLGIECIYLPYFRNITDLLDFRKDFDLVLGYRFNVLGRVYDEIRRRVPEARIIFHNVDLHFLREEREAALCGSRSKKITAAITRAAELELIARVDCTIVHTKTETAIIRKHLPVDNIVEFPYIAELHPTKVAFEDRHDVMFLGGFNHPPNVDAVKHFVSSIWPRLAENLPVRARFVIVGPSAPADILALAGSRIVVTGYVEELNAFFDTARVFVAPIRYGAGIKGKVIQSLSYGTPSVITPIAAEGIGLVSGRETIIADDDAEFIEAVLNTYSDRELWHSLQASGYKFIEENFSWKRCFDLFTKVFDTADAVWLARHERALRTRLDSLIAESHEAQ